MDLPPPTIGPPPPMPQADAAVRSARPGDAPGMGMVQVAAWRASYDGVWPPAALDALAPDAIAAVWAAAIAEPPTRSHSVLVALAGADLVGFAATSPMDPSDPEQPDVGEIAALLVAPKSQHEGHGSRLLNAAADRLRDNGFDRVVVWVGVDDEPRRRFLTEAGFEIDGAERTLDLSGDGSVRWREIRLVASLARPA